MSDHTLDEGIDSAELPAIDFHSPGRFALHNPPVDLSEPQDWDAALFQLGQDAALQRFSKPTEIREHALAMMQQARRSLCIYSTDLEPWLYHHSSIQEACTRLLVAHPRNQLRILLRDPTRAVKEGHRLLQLARRLTSSVHIRKLQPDYPDPGGTYLIADNCGLLERPKVDQYVGYALYCDLSRVRVRQAEFDKAWDHGLSDANLRSFLL